MPITTGKSQWSDHGLFNRAGVRTSFWDYVTLLTGNVLLIPIGIASVTLTSRILGREGYGYITIYSLVTNLMMMVTANWTAASLMRFGREEYDQEGKLNETLWARTIILVPCFLVAGVAIFLCRGLVASYMGMPDWVVWLVIGSLFMVTGRSYLDNILQAVHRMKAFSAVQLVFGAVSVVGLTLILVGFFSRTYLSVIIVGLMIQGGTLLFLSLLLVPRRALSPVKTSQKMVREVLSFSSPILLGNLAAYLVNWIDVVVIKYYFSMSDVGGYQLAYNMFNLLAGILASTTVLMTPILVSFLAAKREDLILRYSTRLVPQGFLLWATLIGLVLGICPPIFRVFFGKDFSVSIPYFQFLAMGLVISGLIHFHSGEITAYKLMKLGMWASIARGLVNLIGDLILVPRMGPLGATLATTGGIVVAAVFYVLICQRQLKERLLWQFLLVVPALLSLVTSRMISGPQALLLAILITLASSFYLAKALHLFRPDDLVLLDHIQIPSLLKRAVIRVYPFLISNTKLGRREGIL